MAEILVIRELDTFSRILTEHGFLVVNLPLVKTEPLADLSDFEDCLKNLDCFDGIFITSVAATEVFLSKAVGKRFDGKFYVLGKRSADLLEAAGYKTFSGGNAKTAAELLKSIPAENLIGRNYLFVRGDKSLRVVPETLEKVAAVRETIVYRTVRAEIEAEKLIEIKAKFSRGDFRAGCFFSPSGAEEFTKQFENFSQSNVKIAAIGETTARFIETSGLRVDFIPSNPGANIFALELIDFLKAETRP